MDEVNAGLHSDGTAQKSTKLLLLVDQFEEIFGPQIEDQADVDWFVRLLVRFFEKPHADLFLVLTMRTGYIGRCADFTGLAELVNQTLYLTPVLRESETHDAIALPPTDYHGEVEPALVDAIISDMGTGTKYDSDNLPLMQHAMLWLWLRAAQASGAPCPPSPDGEPPGEPIRLMSADYVQHGGLRGILERHAEDVLAGIVAADGEHGRQTVEILFRRLCERDAGARYRRSPATMEELCRLTSLGLEELGRVIFPFADPSASFIEQRPTRIASDTLVDISHESLIRQWPALRAWADKESDLARNFAALAGRARRWVEAGGGSRKTLQKDDLVWAETWLQALELYRRSPEALATWSARYAKSGDEWAEPYGGVAGAVDQFHRRSVMEREEEEAQHLHQVAATAWAEAEAEQMRAVATAEQQRAMALVEAANARGQAEKAEAERDAQRWRLWLVVSCATAALALLIIGSLSYRARLSAANLEAQRLLLEMADLHASALANSYLEFGELPEKKRTAVVQELAVVQGKIEQLRAQDVSADLGERLSTLERSVDAAARRVLEAMVVANDRPASAAAQREADEVKRCIVRSDPGKDRDIQQVVPLPRSSGASRATRRAYAILTSRHGVPTLEVAYRRTLTRGGGCVIGLDGVTLPVAAVHKVTMDPEGRWLIERPPAPAEGTTTLPRLHRLRWFEVCDPNQKKDACGLAARRWRVEAVPLGSYLGLAEAQLPAAPADMPAPKPVTRDDELAHLIGPPPQGFEVREQKTSANAFGESGGSELWWGDVLLSSKAQPGYRIAAYARQGDTVAFVVSVRGADARRRSRVGTVCSGAELCQHVIRVVRLPERQDRSNDAETMVGALPIAEVGFVGPPVSGIGFGTGSLEGELAIRFADTGRFATVSMGGSWFRRWLCRFGDPSLAPQPVLFSPAFRNYVATKHGGNEQLYKHIRAEINAACGRQAAPVIADGAERALRGDRPSHILEVEQALLVPGEKHGREHDTKSR
jgi:hypothetical protein